MHAQLYDFEIHHYFEVESEKFCDFEFDCDFRGCDAGAGLRRGDLLRLGGDAREAPRP